MNSDFVLDKFAVRKSFSEASVYYDGLAVLQRKVADRLFSKIDSDDRVEGCYLDIGCGTGFLTE
ncbi:MAG: malonyl-ACP O-methyltransferase BioC, partial [Gammaproteobacteria bacterium]